MASNLIEGFLLGALASVAASLMVIYLLRLILAPKIEIEDVILFGSSRKGEPIIRFKVTNKRPRQAINIAIRAHRVLPEMKDGDAYSYSKVIPLVTEELMVIEPWDSSGVRTDHFNVLNTKVKDGFPEIHKIFDDHRVMVRLRVAATDPISQIRLVFTKHFTRNDVRYGSFRYQREFPEAQRKMDMVQQ